MLFHAQLPGKLSSKNTLSNISMGSSSPAQAGQKLSKQTSCRPLTLSWSHVLEAGSQPYTLTWGMVRGLGCGLTWGWPGALLFHARIPWQLLLLWGVMSGAMFCHAHCWALLEDAPPNIPSCAPLPGEAAASCSFLLLLALASRPLHVECPAVQQTLSGWLVAWWWGWSPSSFLTSYEKVTLLKYSHRLSKLSKLYRLSHRLSKLFTVSI